MTLTEFQQTLHALYQGDVEYPTTSDDEWEHRLVLLKTAISTWDNENGMLWSELWKQHEDGDGDEVVVANTLSYDCPTDFRFPGGFVKTTSSGGQITYWKVIQPHRAEIQTSGNYCYFTGNKAEGHILTFLAQPTTGDAIDFPYYKEPAVISDGADILEMSDPYFAIYFSLSKLHEISGEGDRSIKALQEAQARLSAMKTRNIMPAWYQENSVPDRDWVLGASGFGN